MHRTNLEYGLIKEFSDPIDTDKFENRDWCDFSVRKKSDHETGTRR